MENNCHKYVIAYEKIYHNIMYTLLVLIYEYIFNNKFSEFYIVYCIFDWSEMIVKLLDIKTVKYLDYALMHVFVVNFDGLYDCCTRAVRAR